MNTTIDTLLDTLEAELAESQLQSMQGATYQRLEFSLMDPETSTFSFWAHSWYVLDLTGRTYFCKPCPPIHDLLTWVRKTTSILGYCASLPGPTMSRGYRKLGSSGPHFFAEPGRQYTHWLVTSRSTCCDTVGVYTYGARYLGGEVPVVGF